MSAPPENRAGQRFVSSINIPINADAPDSNPLQQSSKPNERVIPIHVEGRDEPVIPKQQTDQSYSQTPPSQPEKMYGQHRPGFGTWKRDDNPYYTGDPKFFQQDPHFDSAFSQERPNTATAFKQQQPTPPPQPPQKSPTPPPQQPPPPSKLGPIEQIQRIQKDVLELMNQVEQFNGRPKDKQYFYLDEMLTRNLLKLDDVETEGKENIRHARKEAINCIQKCISILEAKATANEQLRSEVMEVDTKLEPGNEQLTSLQVSGISRSGTEHSMEQEEVSNESEATVPAAESTATDIIDTQSTTIVDAPTHEDTKPTQEATNSSHDKTTKEEG